MSTGHLRAQPASPYAPVPGSTATVWGILLAAGRATRFGRLKQFEPLRGHRLVDRALHQLRGIAGRVVVVLPPDTPWDGEEVAVAVSGGDSRAASVRAGLAAVPVDAPVVVVHDSVHPLAHDALFAAVVAAVRAGADGAAPALPATDTLGRTQSSRLVATLSPHGLMQLQMPHAFIARVLRDAHGTGEQASDDASLLTALGYRVAVVPGDPANLHVTTGADLLLAERLLTTGSRR